ncbi:DUF4148 domain-containing protein [Trinickia mobilis]|uniref:DUF4148 domain-containing protein n=1 Tax=Trinickia mobilis TaxID=2816356 RepID=UPI001A8D2C23|nr:DUF4148 domain-containing protein [Trinickia mobilis]
MQKYYLVAAIAFVASTSAAMAADPQRSSETRNTFDQDAVVSVPASPAVDPENGKTRQQVVQELVEARRDGQLEHLDRTLYFGK